MIRQAQEILRKQKTLLMGVIGTSAAIAAVYYLWISDNKQVNIASSTAISLPGDKVNHQEIWMNQIDSQNKKFEAQNVLLEQKLSYLQEVLLEQKKKEQDIEIEKLDLKKEIGHLKQEIKNVSENSQISISQPEFTPVAPQIINSSPSYNSFKEDPFSPIYAAENSIEPLRSPLSEISMEVEKMDSRKNKIEPVEGRIFAGTTVKALLVSSVDAVCGVFSNSDPVPVKLRILDDGHLPKHLTAKLKGGLLIGSAFGNISNERVYVRLERMSLFNPKGEGVEMEVAGYVSGEDGRFGIRGIVIDKSTKMIKNAACSGFLSGAGQILQSAVTKKPVENWSNYSAIGGDMLKQGCANGAGNAFDMLADYYIRRAEQVQPVLQVNAGRIVDITFTYGTSVGDLHVKEKIQECRLRNRLGKS